MLDATTGWFRYDTLDPGTCNDTFGTRAPSIGGTSLGSGSTAVSYSEALFSLAPGTTYYFCAIASNSVGTSFGSVLSFMHHPRGARCDHCGGLGRDERHRHAERLGEPERGRGHRLVPLRHRQPWHVQRHLRDSRPGNQGAPPGHGQHRDPTRGRSAGLTPTTTYYFCAIASNSVGTGFGAVLSFTTKAAPVVTTNPASGVTNTAATLNGSANPNLDATFGWFRYSTTSPGTCDDTFGTRAPATGGSSLGSGNTAVSYSQAISGLTAATTYYFCAIASNSAGTSLGGVLSFTTTAAPVVTTVAASGVTGSTAMRTARPTDADRDHRVVPL
jgi:hypothetical protein